VTAYREGRLAEAEQALRPLIAKVPRDANALDSWRLSWIIKPVIPEAKRVRQRGPRADSALGLPA